MLPAQILGDTMINGGPLLPTLANNPCRHKNTQECKNTAWTKCTFGINSLLHKLARRVRSDSFCGLYWKLLNSNPQLPYNHLNVVDFKNTQTRKPFGKKQIYCYINEDIILFQWICFRGNAK